MLGRDDLEARAAAVKSTAPPYDSLVETGFPEKVHEQLVSEARAVLAGGSADLLLPDTVEDLAEEIDDVTYVDLLENVLLAQLFADNDRRDERVAAAEDRRAPWVVASIATTGLALLSLLALVARALRTSRSGGTPRSHDESHPDLATMLGTPAPESPSRRVLEAPRPIVR